DDLLRIVLQAFDERFDFPVHGNERGDLHCSKQAIASWAVVEEDDVARLLAAKHVSAAQHFFEDVAITNSSARQRNLFLREDAFKAEIGHGSGHNPIALELVLRFQETRGGEKDAVSVHHFPRLTDKERPVGITIESHAQTSFFLDDAFLQTFQMKRA